MVCSSGEICIYKTDVFSTNIEIIDLINMMNYFSFNYYYFISHYTPYSDRKQFLFKFGIKNCEVSLVLILNILGL